MKLVKRIDLIYLIILLILSGYTWRFIPAQVIRGDGFVYLISETQKQFFGRPFFFTGFELSASSLGWLLPKIFGIHIALYWWTAYIVMLITNALFYWLALTIFKKPLLAFIAAVFFALNFFGNFDIYSTHCYCFFLERIIPVLFLLPSALYLHRFLEQKQRGDIIRSLTFYFLGIGIGHWSVFVTAFFLFYPAFWAFVPPKGNRWVRGVAVGAVYVSITIFFVLIQRVNESGFGLKWQAVDFFLHPSVYQWPKQMVRQLVYWTEYPVLLQKDFHAGLVSRIPDMQAIEAVTPYIVYLYIIISFIIFVRLRPKRALLFTIILGTASIFYVNVLFGQYDVLYQPGDNRYLYYPTMLLALFWATFVEVLLGSRKKSFRVFTVVLVIGFILINMTLIRESYQKAMRYNRQTKLVFDYIQTNSQRFPKNTLIVGPYDEIGVYEANFFTEQLAPKGITVMSEYNTYPKTHMWERVASMSAHVVMLEKNRTCCIKEHILK